MKETHQVERHDNDSRLEVAERSHRVVDRRKLAEVDNQQLGRHRLAVVDDNLVEGCSLAAVACKLGVNRGSSVDRRAMDFARTLGVGLDWNVESKRAVDFRTAVDCWLDKAVSSVSLHC